MSSLEETSKLGNALINIYLTFLFLQESKPLTQLCPSSQLLGRCLLQGTFIHQMVVSFISVMLNPSLREGGPHNEGVPETYEA